MNIKNLLSCLIIVISGYQSAFSQVISLSPAFASQDDVVTITFDATLGNGALAGQSQVYAHTGVISNFSANGQDWQHVQGNWGTNDPNVQMTNIGNDQHTITYNIASFYGLSVGEIVEQLAFVFRTEDGTIVGRASDGSDIFVAVFPPNTFAAAILSPDEDLITVDANGMLDISTASSEAAELTLYHDGNQIAQALNATTLDFTINAATYGTGKFDITFTADNGSQLIHDTTAYIVHGTPNIATAPAGTIDGINYIDANTVVLQLYAPNKDFSYVVGDFTDWELDPAFMMNRVPSGDRYWIELSNLTAAQEYRFQYYVGTELIRIADWYADKILDPWNDGFIDANRYPNLIDYPHTKTTHPVSVFQTNQTPYAWDPGITYQKPAKEKLNIYELLIRDFNTGQSFQDVIDSLDYFERLGINAIELMPVNEFEGNESWGYNPSFYFAPDKYYGPKDKMKEMVEECHRRGIAVIMDIALNHSFGQSPMVRLYFDPTSGNWGQPSSENPWFNEVAKHDFNVGYDFNHEATVTKIFVDRVLAYWVEEFQIDGYRLDLSKGFTQVNTLGNTGAWGNYDASRVGLLNRLASQLWAVDPEAYIILEHFADNDEEKQLASDGFLLWGNANHDFNEATLGFSSNQNWANYQSRSFSQPHLISYMESHDEERLQYKNGEFGNSAGTYNVKEEWIGLQRNEAAAVMFFTIPGPKMIWQFGEYGFDFSINRCTDGSIDPGCRLSNKPIVWDYLEDNNKRKLFQTYAAMLHLRDEQAAFATTDFEAKLNGTAKTIYLNDASMNVAYVGNFNLETREIQVEFQHSGTWYDYFSGKELQVEPPLQTITLGPGQYRLFTDVQLDKPEIITNTDLVESNPLGATIYPNPFSESVFFEFSLEKASHVQLSITDLLGREVSRVENGFLEKGKHSIQWDGSAINGAAVPSGCYLYRLQLEEKVLAGRLIHN